MPTPLLIANWKMNLLPEEAVALVYATDSLPAALTLVFASPYPYLPLLSPELKRKSGLFLGAQDVSAHTHGAYTGEVSAEMLKALEVSYVLVGHSERREYHAETDAVLGQKLQRVWEQGLVPVLCVGEPLAIRDEGAYLPYIREQLQNALSHALHGQIGAEKLPLVIAYEPVWAIGTGKTASPAMVEEVHGYIRQVLGELFGKAESSILYGGSVKPENAQELFALDAVDGALVGGASLQLTSMQSIIQSFVQAFAKQ